jgi:hypothetical protein
MALNALNKMLKSGGGLLVGERQTEEAAKNNGLAAPATSPLGLSTLGVNPDAAKMGGTSQQKMAANKQSVAPLPQESAQVVASDADKKSRKQAQAVQGLQQKGSSLDSRVNNIVANRLTQATSGNTLDTTVAGLVTSSGLKDDASKTLFTKFLNGKGAEGVLNDVQYEQLAKDLGIIGKNEVVKDANQLKTYMKAQYFDPKQGKMNVAINENVKVGNVKQQAASEGKDWANELGFDNETALSEFLGISVQELAGKSVKDLNDGIDSRVSTVFSQTAAQQAILNDPSSSDLERQQAAASLGQLSGRGVIAGEQEASRGAEGLRQAETIAFKGKEYVLADLLKDQAFKDEMTGYYGKSTQDRQKLKDTSPPTEKALYEWLDKNEANLSQLETETGKTLDIAQTSTNEAAGAYSSLSSKIKDAKKLEQLTGLKGPTKFGQKKQAPTTSFGRMIESLINTQDPKAAAQVEAISSFLDAAPPEYIDLLKDKDIKWFKENNLWSENQTPDELKNKLTRWMWKRNDIGFLEGDKDVSQFGIPMEEYQDLVSSLATLGENSDLQQIFDENKDGKLDSSKDINNRLKSRYGDSLRSDNPDNKTLGEILQDLRGKAVNARNSFPEEARDGVLTNQEVDNLKRGPVTFETLDKILRPGIRIEGDANDLIKSATYNKLNEVAPSVLSTIQYAYTPSGLRVPGNKESVRGDLVNVQAAIDQLKNANIPSRGSEVAARLLGQLNDWAETLRTADRNITAQETETARKAEETRLASEEKAKQDQANFDSQFTNRVGAGLRDPLGALTDAASNVVGGVSNVVNTTSKELKKLKKKVKL